MQFERNVGASVEAVGGLSDGTRRLLPSEYFEFVARSNGGEGFVGEAYAVLWRIEEVEQLNAGYETKAYLSDTVLIGSDGGGEAYGFRLSGGALEFIRVPFVGMHDELCCPMESSFADFASAATTAARPEGSARSESAKRREIVEIHPVILGGDPTAPTNKTVLGPEDHVAFVTYWNRRIRELRRGTVEGTPADPS